MKNPCQHRDRFVVRSLKFEDGHIGDRFVCPHCGFFLSFQPMDYPNGLALLDEPSPDRDWKVSLKLTGNGV